MSAAAIAQAQAWNRCWKPGSNISVLLHTGNRVGVRMVSPAKVLDGQAVLEFERMNCHPLGTTDITLLDRVRPLHPELVDAAALRGAM